MVVDVRLGVAFALTLGAADGFEAARCECSNRQNSGAFDIRSGRFREEAFAAIERACRAAAASSCRSRPAVL